MIWRQLEIQRAGENLLRWTCLPSEFYDLLVDQSPDTFQYGDGTQPLYPAFWDVDTVTINGNYKYLYTFQGIKSVLFIFFRFIYQ